MPRVTTAREEEETEPCTAAMAGKAARLGEETVFCTTVWFSTSSVPVQRPVCGTVSPVLLVLLPPIPTG